MLKFLRLLMLVFVPLAVAATVAYYMNQIFLEPINKSENKPVLFEIGSGKTFRSIARNLEKQGLVKYWWSLEVLARIRNQVAVINTGEYQLNKAMSAFEILEKLLKGETYKRRVTIKEGQSIWTVGAQLQEAGIINKSIFESALVDQALINRLGIQAQSLEGYLFPETYFFSRPITSEQIVTQMYNEFHKNWDDEMNAQAELLNMSKHEIVILASIIEKESGVESELPLISSVFHNRLKQGMKLQTDPTVIYGIPNFNGNLTRADLERATPYNTYVNYGLPPGPISNPGKKALIAALFPANSQFLYFVADGSGGHQFSENLSDHNAAVAKYQNGKG